GGGARDRGAGAREAPAAATAAQRQRRAGRQHGLRGRKQRRRAHFPGGGTLIRCSLWTSSRVEACWALRSATVPQISLPPRREPSSGSVRQKIFSPWRIFARYPCARRRFSSGSTAGFAGAGVWVAEEGVVAGGAGAAAGGAVALDDEAAAGC